jgi:hypothetical protein
MYKSNKMKTNKICGKCKRKGWYVNQSMGEILCEKCKDFAKTMETVPAPVKLVPHSVNMSPKPSKYGSMLAFLEYKARKADEITVIISADGSVHAIAGIDRSRYFAGGRRRMQWNIKKRLGTRWFSPGILLTLTYDPKRFTKAEAWERISDDREKIFHALNMRMFRKRGKYGNSLKYLWAVEEIPQYHVDKITKEKIANNAHGYPHIHIFFPGLRWLATTAVLNKLWSQGYCDVVYKDNINCASYLCKYISKLDGWSDYSQMLIWSLHKRVYGYSACYRLPDFSEKIKSDSNYGGTFFTKSKNLILESYLKGKYQMGRGWENESLGGNDSS